MAINRFLKSAVSTLSLIALVFNVSQAQNYTSAGNGDWTTAANWTNTSGNGAATPSVNGGYGNRTLNHNQTITGDYNTGSATLTIASGKTLRVTGNLIMNGGSVLNLNGDLIVEGNFTNSGNGLVVNGTLTINGGLTNNSSDLIINGTVSVKEETILNGRVRVNQGGKFINRKNLRVNSDDYLHVGTNVNPPAYADLIVYGNLNAYGSGDVIINRNGRVAIFGNVNDNGGGGTILRVNNGGQMYVNGNINYAGGGSTIQNNNTTTPYGLYVNGVINNTGGGGTTTANTANQQTLFNTNPGFANWLGGIEDGPLPIELKSFIATLKGNSVQLNWITAKEENFSHFELERSLDQKIFETIGIIQGQGESFSDVHYHFEDSNAPYGKIYFRLKAVDIDDTFEYSPVISVEISFKGQLSIYPNPFNESSKVTVRVPNQFTEHIPHMALYNMEGGLLQEFRDFNPSENLKIDKVKPGFYLLKVQYNGLEENIRLVVK